MSRSSRGAAALMILAPTGLAAQSLGIVPGRDLPAWMTGWSALTSRANFPRQLPGSGTALPHLLFPPPQIGIFWTGANPAGVVDAVRTARTDFTAALAREDGDYRRPLDPGGRSVAQVAAQSGRPLGSRFGLIGRVVLDRETRDPGALADETQPYATSPFPIADTTPSPTRQTRARMEGAAAWTLGSWAVGATLGYEALDWETIAAPVVRRSSRSGSGLIVGIARRVGPLRLGLEAGYRSGAETIDVFQRAGSGQLAQLEGYRDVAPLAIDAQHPYYRRIDDGEPWAGITVSGRAGGTAWALFADRSRLRERGTRQEQDEPAADRWTANARGAGGAARRAVGTRVSLTVRAVWRSLAGSGTLALDTTGFIATADEQSGMLGAEIRVRLGGTGTGSEWALGGGWDYQRRRRKSSLPDLAADIKSLTPTIWSEIGVPVGPRLTLLGGLSVSAYRAASVIPDPRGRGSVYTAVLAPELALATRAATPAAIQLGARYRTAAGAVWLAGHVERLQPSGPIAPIPFSPSGRRTAASLVVGMTIDPRPDPGH